MRLFAAVVPPASAVEHLEAAASAVRDSRLTWTVTAAWHVTLAFYGAVDDERVAPLRQRLVRAARRHTPFDLRLAGAGRFGTAVLWTGVSEDEGRLSEPRRLSRPGRLARLAGSASAAGRRMGLGDPEARPYRPHLTLARSSRQADLRPYVAALEGYLGPVWTVDDISLVRSHLGAGEGGRARYETVATMPLTGV